MSLFPFSSTRTRKALRRHIIALVCIITILVFGVVGAAFIRNSSAAANDRVIESESGTSSSPARIQPDLTASKNMAVIFGTQPADPIGYSQSFESDLDGWVADYDLPCEYNTTAANCRSWPLEWSITRTTDQAQDGTYGLTSFLNGKHDDGTIWMEKAFAVAPGATVTAAISFQLWSKQKAGVNNWPVIAYAGVKNPETELDFPVIGLTDMASGWKQYSAQKSFQADSSGVVWIGFGFKVVFENIRTYYMDAVTVNLQ